MGIRIIFLLLVGVLFVSVPVSAQSSLQEELSRRNLTLSQAQELARQAGINPNNPEELTRFAKANGVSDEQIQKWLSEMGMSSNTESPSGQVQDLRDATVSRGEIQEATSEGGGNEESAQTAAVKEVVPKDEGLEYFGYKIFSNTPDAFKPGVSAPVDDGYIIGPDDEMRLTMWGSTELQYELQVDAEGRIFIPSIGQLTIAGQTLKELREYLKKRLSQSYAGLMKNPPTIFLDVTLTRLRPIRIFVIGEVDNPGGYTFSSYSTLFNALYAVGGPTTNGSLRDIRLIRNGVVVESFDFYEFLMEGRDTGSIKLQNNDRIFIPKRLNTVKIRGPVNRPAIYEFKDGEDLQDLLLYAGDLKPEAYGKRFHVKRIIPMRERTDPSIARRVQDFNLLNVLNGNIEFKLQDEDEIIISAISDRVEDVVFIGGAVFQPGPYEIGDSILTVRDLIIAADSLTGDAINYKAELIRTNEDLTQTLISLDLQKALDGDPYHDIPLQRLDKIDVFSRTEIENVYNVEITGAITNPDTYRWRDSLTVYDLLFKGKGLFDPEQKEKIYLKRADLIRRTEDGRNSKVIPFNLEEALNNKGFGTSRLQPYDKIRIYPNTVELIEEKFVIIDGNVKNPGRYEFNENMSLEDLLIAAGGFTESSSLKEAEVSRLVKPEEDMQSKSWQFFWPLLGEVEGEQYYHPSLADTLFSIASNYQLQHRDHIYIRKNQYFETQKEIELIGELTFPGSYTLIREKEKLSDVIQRAGGITREGYAAGARLKRNGIEVVIDLDELLEGNRSADIFMKPGDTLNVPKVPNTVLVTGNVALDGFIKFREGERLTYYLDQAGGMQQNSYKYVQLTQANGAIYQVKRKGLFKQNPRVEDGARINVIYEAPEPETEKQSAGELLQKSVATLTSALTIIILVDRAFN